MHGYLDSWQTLKEGPELPGGRERKRCIEIDGLSEPALRYRVLEGEHHRREAKLKIDRREKVLLPANFQYFSCP